MRIMELVHCAPGVSVYRTIDNQLVSVLAYDKPGGKIGYRAFGGGGLELGWWARWRAFRGIRAWQVQHLRLQAEQERRQQEEWAHQVALSDITSVWKR